MVFGSFRSTPSLHNLYSRRRSYSTAFNPLTSSLIYPPSGTGTHHVITSVFADTPPRPLPFPPVLSSSGLLSLSPDGAWMVGYHSAPSLAMHGGPVFNGDLFVFSSQILDSGMTMGQFMPAATFPIGVTTPLSGIYLYPPRTRLGPGGQRAAPALGPAPPPGYAASKSRGPTCLFMTADVLYFLHPHPVPATVVLDTQSSAAVPGESISAAGGSDAAPLNWTINALKCPLGSRSYTDLSSMAAQVAPLPAFGAQRGWFGMVGGSDGVWAAVEKDGEVQVVRVDIGLDANNMPCEQSQFGPTPSKTNALQTCRRPRCLRSRARRSHRLPTQRPCSSRTCRTSSSSRSRTTV